MTTIIILIIVAGFVAVHYLGYKERARLHLLIKSKDIHEVNAFEKEGKKKPIIPYTPPPEMDDVTYNKTPKEIRESFNLHKDNN